MTKDKTVGVVGLGAIGFGTARSLIRGGFKTAGFDLREEALKKLEAEGGIPARTCAELGATADVVIVMVINADQMRSAMFGPAGLAEGMKKGGVVISAVTMAPADAVDIAAGLAEKGIVMLDSPSSGGAARAAKGDNAFMASGDPKVIDSVMDVYNAIASNVYRVGDAIGQGSTMKTIHQLMAGVHIAVGMEALAFGMKMGIDPQAFYEVITGCAGNSFMFENRAPHILKGDVTPMSAVDIFVKDLGIVLDTARANRFPAPIAAAAHQQYIAASAAGYGREDDSAVIKVYRDLTGITLPDGPNPGK